MGSRTEKVDKYDVVIVTCQFEKMALDVRVVFNADKQVTGLNFRPAKGGTSSNRRRMHGLSYFVRRKSPSVPAIWLCPAR